MNNMPTNYRPNYGNSQQSFHAPMTPLPRSQSTHNHRANYDDLDFFDEPLACPPSDGASSTPPFSRRLTFQSPSQAPLWNQAVSPRIPYLPIAPQPMGPHQFTYESQSPSFSQGSSRGSHSLFSPRFSSPFPPRNLASDFRPFSERPNAQFMPPPPLPTLSALPSLAGNSPEWYSDQDGPNPVHPHDSFSFPRRNLSPLPLPPALINPAQIFEEEGKEDEMGDRMEDRMEDEEPHGPSSLDAARSSEVFASDDELVEDESIRLDFLFSPEDVSSSPSPTRMNRPNHQDANEKQVWTPRQRKGTPSREDQLPASPSVAQAKENELVLLNRKKAFIEKVTLVNYGQNGQYAAKSTALIKAGSELYQFDKERVEDFLKVMEVMNPQELDDGDVQGVKRGGCLLPFHSIFIPTIYESEGNVRFVKEKNAKKTQVIAVKDILPHEPLRIQVSGNTFMNWSRSRLEERHNRPLPVKKNEFGVIPMDEIYLSPELQEEWKSELRKYRTKNSALAKRYKPGIQAVNFIIDQLVFKEIFEMIYSDKGVKFPESIEVKPAGKAGLGAYANRDIEKDEYFGIYAGLLTRYDECQKGNNYLFELGFALSGLDEWCISAKTHGNSTRFMNHANPFDRECNANSEWCIYGHRIYILYKATKNIKKGEEIRYNYGQAFWRDKNETPLLQFGVEDDGGPAESIDDGKAEKGVKRKNTSSPDAGAKSKTEAVVGPGATAQAEDAQKMRKLNEEGKKDT